MEHLKLEIDIDFCALEELSEEELDLVYQAANATENAYAKYSRFYVGAAVRLANGRVFIGSNQENAAFPSGLCAERTAVFAAQANCPDQPVTMIAIAARNDAGLLPTPVTPCGACRQVLLESEMRFDNDIEVILYGTDEIFILKNIRQLMPLCFEKSSLNK